MRAATALVLVTMLGMNTGMIVVNDGPASRPAAADTFPHPVVPDQAPWVGDVLRVAGAVFLLAALLGPIIRRNAPRDLPPPTHSHDEPPGTSGLHGRAGTDDPNRPERP